MIVYKYDENGKLIEARHNEPDNYVLQENEVEKVFTQEEIDAENALILQQQNLQDVQRQLSKANGIALDMFVFIRKDNVGLTDNQKNVLKGLAVKLYQGDVEGAIEDFNAIQRPANENKMQKVYDALKTEFDNL